MGDKTYYEILECGENDTLNQIKENYLELVKKYHPDTYKGNTEEATKKIVEINIAFETLKNPDKRRKYDEQLAATRGNIRILINHKECNLGTLKYGTEARATLVIEVIPEFLKDYKLELKWKSGSTPKWINSFEHKELDNKKVELTFTIHSDEIEPKTFSDEFIVTCDNNLGKRIFDQSIPFRFVAEPPVNQNLVDLVSGRTEIHAGLLEKGERTSIKEALRTKEFFEIKESISIAWKNQPFWASKIDSYSIGEAIFPRKIQFEINTNECDPECSPYTGMILVRHGKKLIGQFPVVLRVKKVPKPNLVTDKGELSLGSLSWYQSKLLTLKIENTGDPPKYPLEVKIEGISGGTIESINPSDITSYPKTVVVAFDPSQNNLGDYTGTIKAGTYDTNKIKVPMYVKILDEEQIKLEPSEDNIIIKSDVSMVETSFLITNQGGFVPNIRIRWGKMDAHTLVPEIKTNAIGDGFPALVKLKLDLRFKKFYPVYVNQVLVQVLNGAGEVKTELEFKITIIIKNY